MEIVIADHMEDEVVSALTEIGKLHYKPADLNAALANADILVVRSATKVTAELLAHAPKLRMVVRAGVGLDNVDAKACEAKGIKVANTPGASSNAVAELALGLMLSLCREIPKADSLMKKKIWAKKELEGREIAGKTLGIVGFGRIGSLLGKKAHALGMKILYYNDVEAKCEYAHKVSLEQLLAESDFVSLHVPSTPQTKGMMNAARIGLMKKTACIVNTSRGDIIDDEALYAALRDGVIKGAALDVYREEPYMGRLTELPNAILTPHVGASTKEAQMRIGEELVQKIKEFAGKA